MCKEKLWRGDISMSGNASRKHKQHMQMQEHRRLFGDVSARTADGRVDLVAFGASQGRVITSSPKYDLGKVPVKTKKNNLKAL
jgi:hypothetical protein